MDINDIKPPGTNGSFVGSDYENVDTKRDQNFAATKDKLRASGPEATSTLGLSSLANCSKAALDDPQKLESIVRASISELVEQGQDVTGPLTAAQKQDLVDFLSEDPKIKKDVERLARKVAG